MQDLVENGTQWKFVSVVGIEKTQLYIAQRFEFLRNVAASQNPTAALNVYEDARAENFTGLRTAFPISQPYRVVFETRYDSIS